ncbi:MAG: hypothetical protein H7333_03535 [Bdellovibrionales bacterium]|nr:hypothetical protein [Oligoflexia bacterium]
MSWSKSLSEDKKKDADKKDLTGIFELASLSPPPVTAEDEDPFAVNEMQAIEQVDVFASIDSLGMIDHAPVEEDSIPAEDISPVEEAADLFPVSPEENPGNALADLEATRQINSLPPEFTSQTIAAVNDFTLPEMTYSAHAPLDAAPPLDYLDGLKHYSQRTQEFAFEPGIKAPFHLSLQGTFDPYSRDRLLLFINENPIGINSSDLDLQLKSGRVLFPRISEFAGIKLIQDLRDSGLLFKLTPSSRDEDEAVQAAPPLVFSYESGTEDAVTSDIPVLPEAGFDPKLWKVIDSMQMMQYLRAEILEVEKSELFQNLIDRMLEALKRKAKLKGADALNGLTHEVKALRLPSQYQVELRANLLKKL